ncbi:MAG: HU family DNA-binding protein [Deltaproteobacteria bacterium]|jgi:DNA-binding protein HU-beta|nr:HU family DNA-binding protein [Deltaproteobacteria bacterium]
MTKAELIDHVHGTLEGVSKKETGEIVQAVFDTLTLAIKNGKRFSYAGFGTFNVKERAARRGRNPRSGKEITIPASKSVGFKAAPTLKGEL